MAHVRDILAPAPARRWRARRAGVLALAIAIGAGPLAAQAGEATVWGAKAVRTGDAKAGGLWTFEVTLGHADEGWDHYADRYDILSPDGALLGSRILAHPHVEEQPFTRALSGVEIPDDLTSVLVRGHDSVHGEGPTIEVELPR